MTARDREDEAFSIVFGVIAAILVVVCVVACIVGPLTGHWEPDLAVGFWLAIAAIWYGVYLLKGAGVHINRSLAEWMEQTEAIITPPEESEPTDG